MVIQLTESFKVVTPPVLSRVPGYCTIKSERVENFLHTRNILPDENGSQISHPLQTSTQPLLCENLSSSGIESFTALAPLPAAG